MYIGTCLVIKPQFNNCNMYYIKVLEVLDFSLRLFIVSECSATYYSTFLLVHLPACLANSLVSTLQSRGGYSQKNWEWCAALFPKPPMALFMTPPYPTYDLSENLIPYLCPGPVSDLPYSFLDQTNVELL